VDDFSGGQTSAAARKLTSENTPKKKTRSPPRGKQTPLTSTPKPALHSHFSVAALPMADTLRPAPSILRCSTRPAPRTLTEAHTSRRRSVFRGTPETENVEATRQGEAVSGRGCRRRGGGKARGHRPAVGGNGGGHRRADCQCATARPPASHCSCLSSRQSRWQTA
jgi:hypothetical protein